MAVNLDDILAASTGERIGRQSDASTNFLAMLDRGYLKNLLETDPIQAAAIKDIQRGPSPAPSSGP